MTNAAVGHRIASSSPGSTSAMQRAWMSAAEQRYQASSSRSCRNRAAYGATFAAGIAPTSISPPTRPPRCGSPLFHVKQKRGSTPMSRCCCNGRPRPIWSRPSTLPQLWTRHIADSLQLLTLAPDARTLARFRLRRRLSRRRAGLCDGRGRAVQSLWSSATPRRRRSCARRCGSPAAPGTVILADIGDNVDRFPRPYRLHHRARGGSATPAHRFRRTADASRSARPCFSRAKM